MPDTDDALRAVVFESAKEHLTREVPVVPPSATVGEVRSGLAGRTFACASTIAVCRDGVLAGLLTLENLLSAPESARVEDLMDPDPPLVGPEADQEVAAWKAVQHELKPSPALRARQGCGRPRPRRARVSFPAA